MQEEKQEGNIVPGRDILILFCQQWENLFYLFISF